MGRAVSREIGLRPVAPELEAIGDLGSDPEERGFSVRIGDRPVGVSLPKLVQSLGGEIPPDLDVYKRFGIWLVPHRLGVMRRSGSYEPTSIGLEIEYLTGGATCSVVGLLPAPEFVERAKIGVGLRAGGQISAAGDLACLTEAVSAAAPSSEATFSLQGEMAVRFDVSVVTPVISATGVGSSRAEWLFTKHDESLYGRDVETWSIVLLQKRAKELVYRARYNLVMRRFLVPVRYESEWEEARCTLEH